MLRSFGRHLVACYLTAGDAYDKGVKIIAGLLFITWIVSNFVAPTAPIVGYLTKPEISDLCEHALVVVIVVWGLIWLPFNQIIRIESQHKEALAPLVAKIVEYEIKLRPQFILACALPIDGCSITSYQAHRHYFRVRIINKSSLQGVDGCSGHLLRIEKNGKVVRRHDTNTLPFAPSHEPDAGAKTLMPGIPYYIDVLTIQTDTTPQTVLLPELKGHFSIATTINGTPAFDDKGEYILTIKVVGIGVPTAEARLRFKWTFDYASSSLDLIP